MKDNEETPEFQTKSDPAGHLFLSHMYMKLLFRMIQILLSLTDQVLVI